MAPTCVIIIIGPRLQLCESKPLSLFAITMWAVSWLNALLMFPCSMKGEPVSRIPRDKQVLFSSSFRSPRSVVWCPCWGRRVHWRFSSMVVNTQVNFESLSNRNVMPSVCCDEVPNTTIDLFTFVIVTFIHPWLTGWGYWKGILIFKQHAIASQFSDLHMKLFGRNKYAPVIWYKSDDMLSTPRHIGALFIWMQSLIMRPMNG